MSYVQALAGSITSEWEQMMAKTALELTAREMASYHTVETLQKRRIQEKEALDIRFAQAQELARHAAALLREQYGATRVVLFGSTAHRPWFTLWSDVDLAVWGVAADRFYAAVAAVTGLSLEIAVDLVDPASCSPSLQSAIEDGGIDL